MEGEEFEWRGGNRHRVRVTRREKEKKCRRMKKEREDRFHGGRRKEGVGGASRGRG